MSENSSGRPSSPCHKARNFDLIIKKLEEHYPGRDYRKAYQDIRTFLAKMGFEHRQGSGYHSTHPMSNLDVLDVVGNLYATFPWFVKCVRKFDVTDVGEVYDLAKLFENYTAAKEKPSVLEQIAEHRKAAAKDNGLQRQSRKKERPDHSR